jgi:hypothetical protein
LNLKGDQTTIDQSSGIRAGQHRMETGSLQLTIFGASHGGAEADSNSHRDTPYYGEFVRASAPIALT